MELIDKDAVLAEIERIENLKQDVYKGRATRIAWEAGKSFALIELTILLDTLEVKEVNLEKDVRQILSLYYEGIKHYDDIIKEERKENGGSDLAIKIMDGVVDARELGIQYVIDKLKAQKGE